MCGFSQRKPPLLGDVPRQWWHRRVPRFWSPTTAGAVQRSENAAAAPNRRSLIGLLGTTLSNMKDDQPETPDKTLQHHLVLTPREKCKVSARDQGNTKRLLLFVLRLWILYLCLLCAQYRWCHYINELHQSWKSGQKDSKRTSHQDWRAQNWEKPRQERPKWSASRHVSWLHLHEYIEVHCPRLDVVYCLVDRVPQNSWAI